MEQLLPRTAEDIRRRRVPAPLFRSTVMPTFLRAGQDCGPRSGALLPALLPGLRATSRWRSIPRRQRWAPNPLLQQM